MLLIHCYNYVVTICKVQGCESSVCGRGYCGKHYQRWRTHGDPLKVLPPRGRHVKPRCCIDGCGREAVARELCGLHYQRWVKFGDPLVSIQGRDRSAEDRFWSFVDKDGPTPEHRPDLGPCWVWTGGLSNGYGVFWLDRRQAHAHIVAFAWAGGEVGEDQEHDHLCRNRACVRSTHLEAVTHWTNVARGISPHGVNAVKTHCKHGHPFDAGNTYIRTDGARSCRACGRAAHDRWEARKRAK